MKLPINYNEANYIERRKAREKYIEIQEGDCCHCGFPLTGDPSPEVKTKKVNKKLFPPNFFKWPIHLHHSHENEMTIGAVHNYCNAVLWQHHDE